MRIFPKLKGMVSTGKACFEIAQHGVDPPELGQIQGLAAPGDDHRMRTPRIGYSVETREAIGQDLTFCIERAARPVFYGGTGKSLNRGKSRVDGMSLRIHRDSGNKRDFVLRPSSGLATGIFPAQIGIIGLYRAQQSVDLLAFDHGLHQLMVDVPGRGVADAELALQSQCRQSRFGLANQIKCQKPRGQRQVGTLKEGLRQSTKSGGGNGCIEKFCASHFSEENAGYRHTGGNEIHLASIFSSVISWETILHI